jgi:hypothetical protein
MQFQLFTVPLTDKTAPVGVSIQSLFLIGQLHSLGEKSDLPLFIK